MKRLDERFKLVRIIWTDSQGASARWNYFDEDETPREMICVSTGYLVYDGESVKKSPRILRKIWTAIIRLAAI